MKKGLLFIFSLCSLFIISNSVYASEITEEKVNDYVTTVTGAENSDELLKEFDLEAKQKGALEFNELNGITTDFSTYSASYCMSQCQDAYRFDSNTKSNGYANNYSSIGGYHWNNGIVHWTGVHGGSSVTWNGSGTAKFIKIDHILTYNGAAISVSASPGFTGTSNTRTLTGIQKDNTNSHMSSFSGGSASSGIMLYSLVHESIGYVRGSDTNDYKPMVVLSID